MNPACERAREAMLGAADGELSAAEGAWLTAHADSCADCRSSVAQFAAIDARLLAWGEEVAAENPPRPGHRALVAVSLFPEFANKNSRLLWGALAAAAALLVAFAIPRDKPAPPRDAAAFVEIPYLAPLDPHENSTIVQMDIQVSTLISLGYRLAADPDEVVAADVLVGEDGRAHAVRVRSDMPLTGVGD